MELEIVRYIEDNGPQNRSTLRRELDLTENEARRAMSYLVATEKVVINGSRYRYCTPKQHEKILAIYRWRTNMRRYIAHHKKKGA